MKNILLIVAALGILGAIVAGCSQPAADGGTTTAGETAGATAGSTAGSTDTTEEGH